MTPPVSGGHRATAFTLVEVLAALVLVAIILPVAMRGISLATAAAGEARRQTEAGSLAEAKLNELLATGGWQGSDLAGDFRPDWPDYQWAAELLQWEGAGSQTATPSLRQLSVSVAWTSRGRPRAVTLTTLVYSGSQ